MGHKGVRVALKNSWNTEVGGKVAAGGDNRLKPSDFSSVMYFVMFIRFHLRSCSDIVSSQLPAFPPDSIYYCYI